MGVHGVLRRLPLHERPCFARIKDSHRTMNGSFRMSIAATEEKVMLGPELAGTLMTPEEFDAVEEYDEEYRYELIHGVLVVNPIPSEAEVDPNEELGHLLRSYQDHH